MFPKIHEDEKYIFVIEKPELKTSDLFKLFDLKIMVKSHYRYDELDIEFPAPKKVTVRKFFNQQRIDKEIGLNNAEEKVFKLGITLRERILLDVLYFNKNGKHLDVDTITYCTGSFDSKGNVPSVTYGYGAKIIIGSHYFYESHQRTLGVRLVQ